MDGVLGGRQVEEEATGEFGRTRRGGRRGRKVDVLSVWKDRLLSHGWMGERLLFTSLVRPFLSSRLEGADFSIFYVVAKKGYCSTRVHEQGGRGRGTRQAWLPRREEGKGADAGASRPPPRGFFINPRSAKVLISGKPSADEIVSCFELPSLRFLGNPAEGGILGGRGGREKMNRASFYWTLGGDCWTKWLFSFFFFPFNFVKNESEASGNALTIN